MNQHDRLPRSFAWLYPLAYFGAHLAFMPLLVLLLPRRVETIVGGDALEALSWLLLLGAAVASLSNIAGGAIGDAWLARYGSRRGILAIGIAALMTSYVALAFSTTLASLALTLVLFQIALNLAFAPLGALLADYVPDKRKGTMAGKLNLALPLSTGMIALVGLAFTRDGPWGMIAVGAASCAAMLPLVFAWPTRAPIQPRAPAPLDGVPQRLLPDFTLAWVARFLIQLGAIFMTNYLYLYIVRAGESGVALPAGGAAPAISLLTVVAAALSVVAVIAGGIASDRMARRKIPLFAFAAVLAASQFVMATTPPWLVIVACYALFGACQAGFLSLDSALVAQLLGGNPRRGMWLGVMNLTNTLPALALPFLALVADRLLPEGQVLPFLLVCTGLAALGAGIAITWIRAIR